LTEVRIGNAFLAGDSLGLATLDMGEGIGPAIRSGQLAAEAILSGADYSVASIPRYSFPSLLGIRKE
jgi:flavin-dependent dehydrogenase